MQYSSPAIARSGSLLESYIRNFHKLFSNVGRRKCIVATPDHQNFAAHLHKFTQRRINAAWRDSKIVSQQFIRITPAGTVGVRQVNTPAGCIITPEKFT